MPANDSITSVECRDIQGEMGYRVGIDGSVWTCRIPGSRPAGTKFSNCWRKLKPRPSDRFGHLKVALSGKPRSVHRLVLEAFVGPSPPRMECRHLDGNPQNNNLENLKWGTRKENMQDMMRHGSQVYHRGEKSHAAKLTNGIAQEIRLLHCSGVKTRELSKRFSVCKSTIHNVINGKYFPL